MSDAETQALANAATANAAYRAANNLPVDATNTAILSSPDVKAYLAQQDAINDAAKQQVAFSQPRNDLGGQQSARFSEIVAQYNARSNYSVGSGGLTHQPTGGPQPFRFENPVNAAQIAYNVALSGGNVGKELIGKSIQEGFNPTPYVNQPVVQPVATRQDIAQYDRYGNPLNSMASYEQSMRFAQNPYGRAGYTNPDTLGDLTTQRLMNTINQLRQPLAIAGLPIASETAMRGNILSAQLNRAIDTPGTRDDQFFNNELQKWGENFVEKSSVYHHAAIRTGLPVPANPFEYQGDLAVEFLKGAPNPARPSEWFSPVSGEMGAQLPGGVGLQGAAWNTAKLGVPGVSFADAVRYLNSKEGEYGPYGALWGGPQYVETGHNAPQFTGMPTAQAPLAALPAPFISQYQDRSGHITGGKIIASQETIVPVGEGGGLPAPYRSISNIHEPSLTDRIFTSASQVLSLMPGGMGLAMSLDTAIGRSNPFAESISRSALKPGSIPLEQYQQNLTSYNKNMESYNAEKTKFEATDRMDLGALEALSSRYTNLETERAALESQSKNIQPTVFERAGGIYEGANKYLAQYTTDIFGIGRALENTPDLNLKRDYGDTSGVELYSDIPNFVKGAYVGLSQYPLDIVAGYGGGELLAAGEYGAKYLVARAAMSDIAGVGVAGRVLSTPLAADIIGVGKTLIGAYIIGSATGEVLSHPTSAGKGESFGRTVLQFGGFGAGYSSLKLPEPTNDYVGKGFFSGQQQMGPVERAIYETRVELLARSQPTPEQTTLIRTAGQLGGSGARFNEAPLKAEPNFEQASALGTDYGALIKGVAADKSNPTITKGSMVVASQYPESTVAEAGIRQAHDWDALVFDVGAKFETIAVRSRTGEMGTDVGAIYPSKTVPSGMVSDWSGKPIPENVGMGKVFHHTEYPSKGSWLTPEEHTLFHNIDQGVVAKTASNEVFYNKYRIITPRYTEGGAVPASKQFANAEAVMASGIADLRPIPNPYPGFKPSVMPDVRPAETNPVSIMERIMGNPFDRIAGPRGTSEILIAGRTKGYAGETNAEAAQAQFGRKVGSALKDFAEDPIGQGFRGQKDLYDVISGYKAQKITAREAGVDVTKGEWAENDAMIERMLDLNIHVGSEKGQREGGNIVNLREWFQAKEREVRGAQSISKEISYLPDNSPSSKGVVSPAISASIFASGGYAAKIISSASTGSRITRSVSTASPSSLSITSLSSSVSQPTVLSPSVGHPASAVPSSLSHSASPQMSSLQSSFGIPSGSPSIPSSLGSPPPLGSLSPSWATTPPLPYIPPSHLPSPSPLPPSLPSSPENPRPSSPVPPSPTPPNFPLGGLPFGGGGGGGSRNRKRRKVELFSFEMGEDTPIPTRFGLGGKTVMYVPGSRGIAINILSPGDIAPNRLFDIGGNYGDHL